MEEKILEVLNTIRPYINSDGGDVEFIKYEDGYVYVKLVGSCADCVMADQTLEYGVLQSLQSEIPEIEGVINVPF